VSRKIIDLFSGVGGLSLGFRLEGFEVVLANEIDTEIASSYKKNHAETKMINEDITGLDIEEVFEKYKNKIDGIIGGPPCQGFSQKGQRKTIKDERNFLFLYFYNVVKYIKPMFFVMENVPNLLTAENGYFKDEILSLFGSIGYSLSLGIIDASDFGVPQKRRRAVVFGCYGSQKIELPKSTVQKVTIWDAISDLAFLESAEGEFQQQYRFEPQSDYQRMLRKNEDILYNHETTNHSKIALERLSMIPPNSGKEVLPKEHLTKSIYSGTWSRMEKDDVSVTITTRFDTPSSGKFSHPYLNRAITVREAARIQSFPDNFIFYGTKGSQMKQVGNAVPPILARKIAKTIKTHLDAEENKCVQ